MEEKEEKKVLIPRAEREAKFEARKAELMDRFMKAENLSVEILNATKEKPQETEVILKVGTEAREKRKEMLERSINEMMIELQESGIYQQWEQDFLDCLANSANKLGRQLSAKELLQKEREWFAALDDKVAKMDVPFLTMEVAKRLAENVKKRMRQAIKLSAKRQEVLEKQENFIVAGGALMSTGPNAGQVRDPVQITFSRSIEARFSSPEHNRTRT